MEPRRVGVQRHRRCGAGVHDAMDHGRRELEGLARCVDVRRAGAGVEALLEHGAADHGHGSGGEIVVVEAGVVPRHPADQPGLEVGLVEHALEDALRGVVANEVLPRGGLRGQACHQAAQLADAAAVLADPHRAYSTNPIDFMIYYPERALPRLIVLSPSPPSIPISWPVT